MDALRGNPGWPAIVYVPSNGNRLDESKVVLQESGHFGSPYPPSIPPPFPLLQVAVSAEISDCPLLPSAARPMGGG